MGHLDVLGRARREGGAGTAMTVATTGASFKGIPLAFRTQAVKPMTMM
jgi:hypothetical protein